MPATWDAVVVGAGPSGTLAAERLRARGHQVLLLDAGPRPRPGERVPEVDRRAWPYRVEGLTYDWYRVRAVGGRAHLWGGWAHRFPELVLRRGGWPYGAAELAPYYDELERRLEVVEGQLDERYATAARELELRIVPKRGAVMAGPDRAVWTPLSTREARRARTWVVGARLEHRGRSARVLETFDLRREAPSRIRARAFLLAASPIETARILLESGLGAGRVGRGFVDHMVASFALLEPVPPPPRDGRGPFPGSALVERFVNVDDATARPYPGGFSIELSGPHPLEPLNLERLVPGDQVETSRATLIHAIGETFPHRRRFLDLDPSLCDAAGRPVPRLHVAWSGAERRLAADMKRACVQLADALSVPGGRVIPYLDPLLPGAGHEAGTCPMGGAGAPVDEWGRLRLLDNVFVADAAALPTTGDRHPTLTILAHALRAADAAARHLAGG